MHACVFPSGETGPPTTNITSHFIEHRTPMSIYCKWMPFNSLGALHFDKSRCQCFKTIKLDLPLGWVNLFLCTTLEMQVLRKFEVILWILFRRRMHFFLKINCSACQSHSNDPVYSKRRENGFKLCCLFLVFRRLIKQWLQTQAIPWGPHTFFSGQSIIDSSTGAGEMYDHDMVYQRSLS